MFIRLQQLDVVTGREAGACILRMVQAVAPTAAVNAAFGCQKEDPLSTKDPCAVRTKRKPAASKVSTATETGSEWRVAGARRSTTPWQLAEKQHRLAGKIWSAQRREQQRVQQATRLQAWWRNRLAVRACMAAAKGSAQAAHVLRRAVYKAASAKEELPVFGPEVPTEEQWLEALAHRNATARDGAEALQRRWVVAVDSALKRLRATSCRRCGAVLRTKAVAADFCCSHCGKRANTLTVRCDTKGCWQRCMPCGGSLLTEAAAQELSGNDAALLRAHFSGTAASS